jgi:cytochrome c-type biogenesis protein CcmH/NrfG
MSGWIVMLLLAGAVLLGLWRWIRRDLGAIQFVAAALLLALAGYAWQGQPSMAGAPKARAKAEPRPDSDFVQLRRPLLGEFDRAGAWLTMSEGMIRMGDTKGAVDMLRGQLDKNPRDMDLWLGLADALIQHSGGMLNPAAEMAFNRAAQVAPDHPGPRFFYALAVARMRQFDAADQFLQQVLDMPQTTETWRDYVGRARAAVAEMRAMMPPAQPTG